MKKYFKLLSCFALIFVMLFSFIACDNTTEEIPEDKGPGFKIEREKYFYGVGEMFSGTVDAAQTSEMTINLSSAMGMQSFRIWMHKTSVLQKSNSNEITVRNAIETYKGYVNSLISAGVTNIIAMSHYYLYPTGFSGGGLGVFPTPDSSYYSSFMEMVEESYYVLVQEFPQIKYWECGNEVNEHKYMQKPGGAAYTLKEKAQITTDLMYYASRGIKRANPDAVAVMPGLVFSNNVSSGIVAFLNHIYTNIKSGDFPSTGIESSTDPNDYFDVLNWHPYNFSGDSSEGSSFDKLNKMAYKVAQDNGDDGKKVFFTEYGYTTTQQSGLSREQLEERQGDYIAQDMQNIWNNLPFVETVIIFRLFDWEQAGAATGNPNSIEIGFGLFTSPNNGDIRPKEIGIKLFKQINGQDADLSPIYQYDTTWQA